jgi:hypothetical protein
MNHRELGTVSEVMNGESPMNRNGCLLVVLLVTAAGLSAAGPEPKYRTPRTADGRPDLQGVWNFSSGVPLQRPAAFADTKFFTKEEFDKQHAVRRNALGAVARFAPVEAIALDWMDSTLHVDDLRTSLITYPENGRLPALVEGVTRMPDIEEFLAALSDPKGASSPGLLSLLATFGGGKKDSHTDLGVSERCLVAPLVPIVPGLGDNYVQIVQSNDQVALRTDEFVRIVSLNGKAQVGERLRSSTGMSRGHWEGETLVVETSNFTNRNSSFGAGRSRDKKVVTERFTRTSKNGLEYAATVVDPKTFQDRIELSFPMARVDALIYESACHEGNYSVPNILSAARVEEREAARAAATK